MDRRRSLALAAMAAMFLAAAGSTYKLSEHESRSRARRAWLSEQAAQTRALGYSAEYAADDAAVYGASQFMDLSDAEFERVMRLYEKYGGAERERLVRFTSSALMDWARSPSLTPAKRAAGESLVCEMITEYIADAHLVGQLFGAAMELRLGDNEYLRHLAHEYVTDPASNRQTAEFISQAFLTNPMARESAKAPAPELASRR